MAEQSYPETQPGRLRTLLRNRPEPVLLIGAGASITSGIPAAADTVALMAKYRWCLENDRDTKDPRVTQASYWPWLTSQAWFAPEQKSLADLYPKAVKHLLNVDADRKRFFQDLLRPGVDPNRGYRGLVEILHQRWITTVLTTNFDDCIFRAKELVKRPHRLTQIRTSSDLSQFSSSPQDPQLVYLHGSVDHYTDKNTDAEVRSLDTEIVERIKPMLRDHPIIVVGYRGNEPSVMKSLFRDQIEAAQNFPYGIYWCVRGDEDLAPMVKELADAIGGNFSMVPINGFDELFWSDLWERIREDKVRPESRISSSLSISQPYDMNTMAGFSVNDLDRVFMFTRLKEYSRELRRWCPDAFDEKWTLDTAASFNLLAHTPSGFVPTRAGLLLFGRDVGAEHTNAAVTFEAVGPHEWLVQAFGEDAETEIISNSESKLSSSFSGMLWTQLDALLDILSQVNRQFRLKEETSRMVRPFAPLAIKEMIVNALAHRDYADTEPVRVLVTPQSIKVQSPGGLVAEVQAELTGTDIESFIKSGGRNVKGYRNPVVADLFYGGGAMDHTGSGLKDLWEETVANNGQAEFGPTDDNGAFQVEISARPEAVDRITNTAVPEDIDTVRFAANIIPVAHLPEFVWHAGVTKKAAWEVQKEAEEADLPCPDGHVSDGRYYSLYDLEGLAEACVTNFEAGDIEKLSVDELLSIPGGENIFIKLVSDFFVGHLRARGLYFDHRHERAYYTRTDEESEIQIRYQARLKKAKRTVVKPRLKKDSDEINWYEHKSFSFRLLQFGTEWGFAINPGYAFTRNGYGRYVSRDLTNKLSTRRAAKDFNTTVHNDVTFWLAMIADSKDGVVALRPNCVNAAESHAPFLAISSRLPTTSFQAGIFDETVSDHTAEDELEALAKEIDALAEDPDGEIWRDEEGKNHGD